MIQTYKTEVQYKDLQDRKLNNTYFALLVEAKFNMLYNIMKTSSFAATYTLKRGGELF